MFVVPSKVTFTVKGYPLGGTGLVVFPRIVEFVPVCASTIFMMRFSWQPMFMDNNAIPKKIEIIIVMGVIFFIGYQPIFVFMLLMMFLLLLIYAISSLAMRNWFNFLSVLFLLCALTLKMRM